MKKLLLSFITLLFVSCATYNDLPRNYDNQGYYYDPYPFYSRYYYNWNYHYDWNNTPKYVVRHDNNRKRDVVKKRETNKPSEYRITEKRQEKNYTPTYTRPSNNTTTRFNNYPLNNNRSSGNSRIIRK